MADSSESSESNKAIQPSEVLNEKVSVLHKQPEALAVGNREVITDHYVKKDVLNDHIGYRYKVFVRLNANGQKFEKVSFLHCVFDACYFKNCVFNSCDFTGCRFVGGNFHQSSFTGCTFDYAIFERCQIDDDILESEAPKEDNLKMRFARTLRMNFQQIGDAKAVNKAISLELEATSTHLKKSWSSGESYYKERFSGMKRIPQFFKWFEFKSLDFIWGNGESTLKLIRTIIFIHAIIAIGETIEFKNAWNLRDYWESIIAAPGIFFGTAIPNYLPAWVTSLITILRLISFAFLTAILVKRFGRR